MKRPGIEPGYVLIGLGLALFLFYIRVILIPFILAVFLAYLLNPLIIKLNKKGMCRLHAVYFIHICVLFFLLIFFLYGLPALIKKVELLGEQLPVFFARVEELIEGGEKGLRSFYLPPRTRNLFLVLLGEIEAILGNIAGVVLENFLAFFSGVVSVLIAPFLAFFILRDLEQIEKTIFSFFPEQAKAQGKELARRLYKMWNGFLWGQLWASLTVGILVIISLGIMKVEGFWVWGLFAAITNFIPYLGPIIGSIPPVAIGFLQDPLKALLILVLFIVIQQVESIIVVPKVFSKTVGLHPVTVLFSLFVTGYLFGFLGLLIAVPLAGAIKTVIEVFWKEL